MTDGIIQEVIDNYMINHNISPSLLNGLKQELIEKIEQYLNEYGITEHANAYPTHQIGAIREKLIGDNQE